MPQPVVFFIPGFAGSHLEIERPYLSGRFRVWLDYANVAAGLWEFLDPTRDGSGIYNGQTDAVQAVDYAYRPLFEFCKTFEVPLIQCPYDWRADPEASGRHVAGQLNVAASFAEEIVVLGHSMGGLVAKWAMAYCPRETLNKIKKVITVGTPWEGSFRAVLSLAGVGETLDMIRLATVIGRGVYGLGSKSRLAKILARCPGALSLLPSKRMLDQFSIGAEDSPWSAENWFDINPEVTEARLERAWYIRKQMPAFPISVYHINFRGTRIPTDGPILEGGPDRWRDISAGLLGDGVVPSFSSEIRPSEYGHNRGYSLDHDQAANSMEVLSCLFE